jgi:FkbM family methyltransferase
LQFGGAVAADREQQLIAQFFGDRIGYFVEVGANEPRLRSQTFHLEQKGWTGLLIEPQPELAARLQAERKARVFPVACSSPENAGRSLPLHVAGPLSSLDRSGMAPSAVPDAVIDVPIRTLDQILEEAGAPEGFDFLSIDVEGHEIEVLRGFNVARWRPRLVMIEDHVPDLSRHKFLKSAGYRIVRRYENNGWYVPADADVPSYSRMEVLRKYYLALPVRMLRNFSRRLRGKITAK